MIKTNVSSMVAVLITPGNNYLMAQVPVLTVPAVTRGAALSSVVNIYHFRMDLSQFQQQCSALC